MTVRALFASPRGGRQLLVDVSKGAVSAQWQETLPLQEALDGAGPGDTVRLAGGVYETPALVMGKRRLRIEGAGDVTLDGRRNAVRPRNVDRIDAADFAFLRIVDCDGVDLENLTIQNCWPTAIHIQDSREIRLRRLNINGATFGIFARGEATARILVEHCSWLQDTSIWNGVRWSQIHEDPMPRRELDGDFFRSWRIAGDVVIRRNYISHAFNGVHLFASKKDWAAGRRINDNVWIYENTFSFIRDNAVEAENLATNWFIFANRVFNCHVWLALENPQGGHCYVFGNRGWFTEQAGPPGDCNNGGGIFKGSNNKLFNDGPHYIFNNSFYVRGPYIKKGVIKNTHHFDNALQFARARYHPAGMVSDGRNPFASTGADPACDGRDVADAPFTQEWAQNRIRFFADVVDHPLWPEDLQRMGWPVEATAASPGFAEARNGDFGLESESPCRGTAAAATLAMAGGGSWTLPAGRNRGAMDENGKPYDAAALACPAEPPFPEEAPTVG